MPGRKPFLFVGLDYEDPEQVYRFALELNSLQISGLAPFESAFGYKINLDFILKKGFESTEFRSLKHFDRPIFADLKMWNGKRTMQSAVESATRAGVSYINVYAHSGVDFMKAVVESAHKQTTKVLGVTVLTHYTEEYCQKVYGKSLRDTVDMFTKMIAEAGCDGVILPGTCLDVKTLKEEGAHLQKLVPAVRPEWYGKTGDNYQKQETLIRDAIAGGANLLVCSSPIRKSVDRKQALERTLNEIDGVYHFGIGLVHS